MWIVLPFVLLSTNGLQTLEHVSITLYFYIRNEFLSYKKRPYKKYMKFLVFYRLTSGVLKL